jgi:hypothetical protein
MSEATKSNTPRRNFNDYVIAVEGHLQRLEWEGKEPLPIDMADARSRGLSPRHFAESWVRRHR